MAYITRSGSQFMYMGKRYRGIWMNSYNLMIDLVSKETIKNLFFAAKQLGILGCRLWTLDALYLRYLDYPLGTNLDTDGSFENGNSGFTVGADWSRVNAHSQSGSWAMKMTSGSGYSALSKPYTVSTNTNYVVTFWYDVTNNSGLPPVIFVGTSAGDNTIKDGGYLYGTNGYVRKQVLFNSGANSTIYLTFQNFSGNNVAYIDNINIAIQTTPTLLFNETYGKQLDMIMDEARKVGIKLWFVFADNPTYHSKDTYVSWANTIYSAGLSTSYPYTGFWTSSYCNQMYDDFVYGLANRVNTINGLVYKDDDTWNFSDLGNELRYDVFDSEGGTQNSVNSRNVDKVKTWIVDRTAYLKSIAPNVLLFYGDSGHSWQWVNGDTVSNGSGYGVDYNIFSTLQNLDATDFHMYPTQGGDGSQLQKYGQRLGYPNAINGEGFRAQIRNYVASAKANNKPCVCGEIGFPKEVICDNTYFPLYPRHKAIDEIAKEFFTAGGDIFTLWNATYNSGLSYSVVLSGWDGLTTNENYRDYLLQDVIRDANSSLLNTRKKI